MQEVQVQSLDRKDPLDREDSVKKEVATHSSVLLGKSHGQRSLAGYIPWGHKRVGHYLVTKPPQPPKPVTWPKKGEE